MEFEYASSTEYGFLEVYWEGQSIRIDFDTDTEDVFHDLAKHIRSEIRLVHKNYGNISYSDIGYLEVYSNKSRLIANLLCFFCVMGAHRLYLGHRRSGIFMIIAPFFVAILLANSDTTAEVYISRTMCAMYILWCISDIIRVLTNKFRDSNGLPLK